MRTRSAGGRFAGLLAAVILLGVGCFPIPSIEEKVIELVTTSAVTAEFQASGLINIHEDEVTVALGDSLDLPQILSDAGIDVGDVQSISFGGASYRVVEPDPVADRRIEDGEVTVQREGGSETTLVASFSAPVVVTGYHQTLDLDPAGVAVIDGVLADLLAAAQGSAPVTQDELTFRVSGRSEPTGQESNFRWELRLYVSIVGQIELDLITF